MVEETYYLDKDRIPVFIGKEGITKKMLEQKFSCKLDIDSESGEVTVEAENLVNAFIISNIITAINLGHSPQSAVRLEDENFVLDMIDVKPMVRDHARMKTVLGRVIGKEGSTRKLIEEMTKCSMSVKDSFVSFIGPHENTHLVHEAIEMLIKGASHKTIYHFLERNRQQMDTGLL